MSSEIRDINLAESGEKKIEWEKSLPLNAAVMRNRVTTRKPA